MYAFLVILKKYGFAFCSCVLCFSCSRIGKRLVFQFFTLKLSRSPWRLQAPPVMPLDPRWRGLARASHRLCSNRPVIHLHPRWPGLRMASRGIRPQIMQRPWWRGLRSAGSGRRSTAFPWRNGRLSSGQYRFRAGHVFHRANKRRLFGSFVDVSRVILEQGPMA